MSTMRRITTLYSRTRWRMPSFYVDSRDAVDDGTGDVLSVADRINGWSFAADTSANRPVLDTALLGGTQAINFSANAHNLIYAHGSDIGFGGEDHPVSFVARIYPTVNVTRTVMATHVANTPPTIADGLTQMLVNANGAAGFMNFVRDEAPGSALTNQVSVTLDANEWHTVGWSFTGSAVRHFLNGVFLEQDTSNLATVGVHTSITLGNATGGSFSLRGYAAAWKGWAGVAISDAQHLYEHNQMAAWAA